jgi:outer membrane beta-barrel protein
METGFRRIFLSLGLVLGLSFAPLVGFAQDAEAGSGDELIRPEVERTEFDEAQIDADDFELMIAVGYLSIEDFGVNSLQTVKLNYHVNEAIFVQLAVGESEGGETSYEVLAGGAPLLTDEERKLSYYSINLGYNVLPGESFVGDDIAHNSAFYATLGIGNTEFAGDDRFTINYGAGFRFLLNDAVAFYTDFRNNMFDMDVFGENKGTNNLEFTLGASWFF